MSDEISKNVASLRKRKKLTLEQLAEQCGSTKSYIWEMEKKPNIRPSAVLVYQLAIALDTTIEVLLGVEKHGSKSEQDKVFLRKYSSLNARKKRQLAAIMEVLQ